MKKSKLTETQITSALKEFAAGKCVGGICRECGANKQKLRRDNHQL